MALELTHEQSLAVNAKPTVLVSAAAGSGKTAVLVERVIRLITDPKNPIDADKLLIVTFTNAAAAEMRTRIEKRLYEESIKQPNNKHIIRQQILIESAKIQTIDAFCIDLVRKNFNFLGVSPDFKIIDPGAANTILEETALEIISEQLEAGDEDFLLLADSLGGEYGVSMITEVLLSVYNNSRTMPFGDKWLEQSVKMYDSDVEDTVWFKEIFTNAQSMLNNCLNLIDNAIFEMMADAQISGVCLDIFNEVRQDISFACQYAENCEWNRMIAFCNNFDFPPFARKITKNDNFVLKSMLSDVRGSIKDTITKLSDSFYETLDNVKQIHIICRRAIAKLVEIIIQLRTRVSMKMNEQNVLTFEMAENLAMSLLCEYKDGQIIRSQISRQVCNDFAEVLVDEYQDTNTLQDRLLFAVSDDGKKLFMVGDVKQSIYGFRYANPENFLNYKNNLPLYNENECPPGKIILDSNFRSRKGICNYINFAFRLLFNSESCGMDYGIEDELKPRANFSEINDPAVELRCVGLDGEYDKTESEARQIADYILKNVGKEIVTDTNSNKLRPAQFNDFAILMRSPADKANVFADVFARCGIPVSVENADFIKTAEIQIIISILKAIDNPTNDISLLAAASSPVFGIDFDKIAAIKASNRSERIYGSFVLAAKNGDAEVGNFLNLLKSFQKLSVTMPLSELIDEIYSRTSLIEVMSVIGEAGRRRENLLQFKELVFNFEQTSNLGLSGFIRHIDKLAQNNDLKIPVHSDGCVRIMSIHASKGLQFPICILASCSSLFNKSDTRKRLLVSEKYGLGLKIKTQKFDSTTISRQMISIAAQQKLIAEELRLLYVAMTRAVDKLVMFICEKRLENKLCSCSSRLDGRVFKHSRLDSVAVLSANSYSDWLLSVAMLHKDGKELCDYAGIGHSTLNLQQDDLKITFCEPVISDEPKTEKESSNLQADPALVEKIRDIVNYEYKWSKLLKISAKTSVTEILEENSDTIEPFTRKPECVSEKGLTPAERGTATHRFLQFADYSAAKSDIKAELKRLVEFEFITQYEADAIDLETADKYFKSELCDKILKSNFVRKEQKFIYEIPAGDEGILQDDSVLVQGCVDLLFEDDNGLLIVDFKTTRFDNDEQFIEKYRKQLEIYSDAISKMYDKKVVGKYIYSLYLNKTISV